MDGKALKQGRLAKNWTQKEAAKALGVTQAYLSMLETGTRMVSKRLTREVPKILNLPPTALPLPGTNSQLMPVRKRDFGAELAALGYPGFAYLRTRTRRNPAAVLLDALNEPDLDARVAEGLPWLTLAYVDMDWEWLVRSAKVQDRQNRLGFAVSLASEVAQAKGDAGRAQKLGDYLRLLEKARLAHEDTFCRDSMTEVERTWLRQHRPPVASHWNLLTDMESKHLDYAF